MQQFVHSNTPVYVPLVPEVGSADMIANMEANIRRGLPELRRLRAHGETLSIASGGPSLKETYPELKGHVAAVNGSLSFLLDRGMVPHYCGVMDSHPRMALVVEANPAVNYLVASNCDPTVLDMLRASRCRVKLWHATPDSLGSMDGERLLRLRDADPLRIGGGCTIGLRWISLGYVLGYRHMILHGLDSSFQGHRTHAYDDRRDGAWVDDNSIDVLGYRTSLNFLAQVASFGQILDRYAMSDLDPVTFEVKGTGLLQSCTRQWQREGGLASLSFARQLGTLSPNQVAVDTRAAELLVRLPKGPVRGAEVGVFSGALSHRLLARPDLELIMVDSWEGEGAAYHGGADWHASLSQDQQDAYYWAALNATHGMRERRTVIRSRSLDAANQVEDGSLDFVFLDADHSAVALKADLAAWKRKLKPGGLLCGHDYGNPLFPDVEPTVTKFAWSRELVVEPGGDFTWFARC